MRYYIPSKFPFLKPRLISFTELFEEVSAGFIKQNTEVSWIYCGRKNSSAGDLIDSRLRIENLQWCSHGDLVEHGTVFYRASSFRFVSSCPDNDRFWENIWIDGIWPHSFSIRFLLSRNENRRLHLEPHSDTPYGGSWHWNEFHKRAYTEIIVNDREISELLKSLMSTKCPVGIVIEFSIRSDEKIVSGSDISGRVTNFTINIEQYL